MWLLEFPFTKGVGLAFPFTKGFFIALGLGAILY